MDTGERIFDLLDRAGIEQKAFAEAIGASDKSVSKWRTSSLKSYRKYLPQIAEVLNTSVEYLLTGEEKKPVAINDDRLDEQTARLAEKLRQMTPEEQEMIEAQIDVLLRRKQGQ